MLVDESRVIRTVAGLSPYRRQGFVVRQEALGEKRLVHNYGHGGGGITLSWGTSKLATELGLQGHSGPVAVMGSGAVGLATARLAQEAGFPVTIYAAALPPDTTSNIAGGQFHPFAVFHEGDVTPRFMAQFTRALDYSWRRYQIMVGDDYGIRWLPTYVESDSIEDKVIANFPPVNRILTPAEHPFPLDSVRRYDTMYVETGRYLRQMIARRAARRRQDRSPQVCDAGRHRDLAGELWSSTAPASAAATSLATIANPIRGQLAILEPQPEVRYAAQAISATCSRAPTASFSAARSSGACGTRRRSPQTIAGIIADHKRFFSAFRCTA